MSEGGRSRASAEEVNASQQSLYPRVAPCGGGGGVMSARSDAGQV